MFQILFDFFLFFLEGGDPVPILIGTRQLKCGKDDSGCWVWT